MSLYPHFCSSKFPCAKIPVLKSLALSPHLYPCYKSPCLKSLYESPPDVSISLRLVLYFSVFYFPCIEVPLAHKSLCRLFLYIFISFLYMVMFLYILAALFFGGINVCMYIGVFVYLFLF